MGVMFSLGYHITFNFNRFTGFRLGKLKQDQRRQVRKDHGCCGNVGDAWMVSRISLPA